MCIYLFIKDRQKYSSFHLNREGKNRKLWRSQSPIETAPRTGKTGGHKVINSVQRVTAQPPQETMFILRCVKHITKSKPKLASTSCNPNTMSMEVENGGRRWQEQAGAWAVPQCHINLGSMWQASSSRVTPEYTPRPCSQPRSHHQELWNYTTAKRCQAITPGKVWKYEGINQTHSINEMLGEYD